MKILLALSFAASISILSQVDVILETVRLTLLWLLGPL